MAVLSWCGQDSPVSFCSSSQHCFLRFGLTLPLPAPHRKWSPAVGGLIKDNESDFLGLICLNDTLIIMWCNVFFFLCYQDWQDFHSPLMFAENPVCENMQISDFLSSWFYLAVFNLWAILIMITTATWIQIWKACKITASHLVKVGLHRQLYLLWINMCIISIFKFSI